MFMLERDFDCNHRPFLQIRLCQLTLCARPVTSPPQCASGTSGENRTCTANEEQTTSSMGGMSFVSSAMG